MNTNEEKIKRYTSGKFSFNDYLSVSSSFRQEENKELKNLMEDDWNEIENDNSNSEKLNHLLDKLHHQINLNQTGESRLFQSFYLAFSKIAVVLLIPSFLIIAVLSYLSIDHSGKVESWAEIHSPIGTRTKFQLPDGTIGWLNSGSSIKYPVNFIKNRNVELSGEAWFDVVHLNSKEFRVITPSFDVKVLGTQLNVVSYQDESTAEIVLEKGKVLVLDKNQEVRSELKPDQHLVYDKSTKKLTKSSINSKDYTSWKDGLLILKNVPMAEIAKRLERRYNTQIILHGDSLKSSIFRATFQDENLDEICKMLSTVAPIQYKIHKRERQPDNTFSKGKIEMWLKHTI